jgi:hypothetical protein
VQLNYPALARLWQRCVFSADEYGDERLGVIDGTCCMCWNISLVFLITATSSMHASHHQKVQEKEHHHQQGLVPHAE